MARRAAPKKLEDRYKLGVNDLVVTRPNGDSYGYVLKQTENQGQPSMVHNKSAPNIPMNTGTTSITGDTQQRVDYYDSAGEKRTSFTDWSEGAGQDTYDYDNASMSRFKASEGINTRTKGQLSLTKSLTFTEVADATGPVIFANGYYWLVCGAGIKYSADGITWTASTINTPSDGQITSVVAAVDKVYFCVPSGSTQGIWQSNADKSFTKVEATACFALCYSAGMLWGATVDGAGYFDNPVTDFTDDTPVYLRSVTTVGLIPAGAGVYWVIRDGSITYIYLLVFDPDKGVTFFKQFAEFRTGFIGQAAASYLSRVYVAGYMENENTAVGWGAVYVCENGEVFPLTMIGENPDEHPELTIDQLDNKVVDLEAGDERLFIQTSRNIYIWDIDDGGYHKHYNFFAPDVGVVQGGDAADSFTNLAFTYEAFACDPEYYEAPYTGGLCLARGKESMVYVVKFRLDGGI